MFPYYELYALAEIDKDKIIYTHQRFMPLLELSNNAEVFYSYLAHTSHALIEQILDMIFPVTFPIEKIKWSLVNPLDLQGHENHDWCAPMRQTILGD